MAPTNLRYAKHDDSDKTTGKNSHSASLRLSAAHITQNPNNQWKGITACTEFKPQKHNFHRSIFFFRCIIFHFKREDFTNINLNFAKSMPTRTQKTRKRSANNQPPPWNTKKTRKKTQFLRKNAHLLNYKYVSLQQSRRVQSLNRRTQKLRKGRKQTNPPCLSSQPTH